MTSEEVGVTPIILSGNIIKSLFAVILTLEMVMPKLTLKISMIPQKSEWLTSLYCLDKINLQRNIIIFGNYILLSLNIYNRPSCLKCIEL